MFVPKSKFAIILLLKSLELYYKFMYTSFCHVIHDMSVIKDFDLTFVGCYILYWPLSANCFNILK